MTRKQKPETPAHAGVRWSGGSKLATNALRLGLITAIALGPIGAAAGWLALNRPTAVAAAPTEVSLAEDPGAGAYAVGFVGAWLSASADSTEDLATYVDVKPIQGSLSSAPWEYRDLVAVSVLETEADVYSVTVSASIRETKYDSNGDGSETWPRRYFQVAVAAVDGAFTPLALPAPVDAPSRGTDPRLAYPEQASLTSPIGATTTEFLRAYLCGTGDLDRFTAPGSGIVPVSPALFVQVDTTQIISDRVASETPSDGDVVAVLATVRTFNIDSLSLPATYSLTLTARAGRWEVSAIEAAPQLKSTPASAVPTPSPTAQEQDTTP